MAGCGHLDGRKRDTALQPRLYRYLALTTGARVIAARDTQYYANTNGPIDFGDWEGPVLMFSEGQPDGEVIFDPAPYMVQRDAASMA